MPVIPAALLTFVRPVPLAILFVFTAVAAVWGNSLAARCRAPRAVGGLFIAAVGMVVALTCAPDERDHSTLEELPGTRAFLHQFVDPAKLLAALNGPLDSPEKIANLALYVPIGLLGMLLWRRPDHPILAGLALSLLVEIWQPVVSRSADPGDVRNNVAGAVIGAAVAGIILLAIRRGRGSARADVSVS